MTIRLAMKSTITFTCLLVAIFYQSGAAQTPPPKKFNNGRPTLVQSLQPDYEKWKQIQEGVTEERVRELLGAPNGSSEIPKNRQTNPEANYIKTLDYGYIRFQSPSLPEFYQFDVYILDGKVSGKNDPFGENLSKDGKPTVPELINPTQGQEFNHFPRMVDFRWSLASGKYPMRYVVEIQLHQFVVDKYRPHQLWSTDSPYLAYNHVGMQKGRWRVKGVNSVGDGDWTEWREFDFKK